MLGYLYTTWFHKHQENQDMDILQTLYTVEDGVVLEWGNQSRPIKTNQSTLRLKVAKSIEQQGIPLDVELQHRCVMARGARCMRLTQMGSGSESNLTTRRRFGSGSGSSGQRRSKVRAAALEMWHDVTSSDHTCRIVRRCVFWIFCTDVEICWNMLKYVESNE